MRALTRLYAGVFLYSFAQATGVPLVSEYLRLDHGASLRFIGVVMALYGVMQIVLRLPMGDMADRRGRRPSLVLAFATTVGSGLLFALGPTAAWAIPAALLFGFSGGVFWVAANSYLFDNADDVPKATSDYTIAMSLAFLVGPPLGHLVADHFGFRFAFAFYSLTSVGGMALMMTLPEAPPTPRPPPVGSSYRRALRLLRHPALVTSALATLVYSMLFSTQQAFFQLHVLAVGLSITFAGLLLGGRQASSLVVRIGLPAVLRRVGPTRILVGGILLMALAMALIPFATSVWALTGIVALVGMASGALIPANLMLVHEGAPKDERGLANGIYGTMLGVGSAIAPFAYGFVGAHFGLAWTFWAAAGVAVVLVGLLAARGARAA